MKKGAVGCIGNHLSSRITWCSLCQNSLMFIEVLIALSLLVISVMLHLAGDNHFTIGTIPQIHVSVPKWNAALITVKQILCGFHWHACSRMEIGGSRGRLATVSLYSTWGIATILQFPVGALSGATWNCTPAKPADASSAHLLLFYYCFHFSLSIFLSSIHTAPPVSGWRRYAEEDPPTQSSVTHTISQPVCHLSVLERNKHSGYIARWVSWSSWAQTARLQIGAGMQNHRKTEDSSVFLPLQPSLFSDLILTSPKGLFQQLLGSRGRKKNFHRSFLCIRLILANLESKMKACSIISSIHFYLLLASL